MSLYTLLHNVGTVQTAPPVSAKVTAFDLPKPSSVMQAVITSTGSATATVQLGGTNDGVNFTNIGSVVVTSNGTIAGIGAITSNSPWDSYGAYVSAITGAGASVTAIMSA